MLGTAVANTETAAAPAGCTFQANHAPGGKTGPDPHQNIMEAPAVDTSQVDPGAGGNTGPNPHQNIMEAAAEM